MVRFVVPPPPPPVPFVTVKLPALIARPPGVMTAMAPDVAPAGTVAVIWVPEFTVKLVADLVLNFTIEALLKLFPVIVTLAFVAALDGEKLLMPGAAAPSTLARNTSA